MVRGGLSLLHAKYKNLILNSVCSIRLQQLGECTAAQNGALITEDLRGRRLIEAPEATINGSATIPSLKNDDALLVHLDANYVGAEFTDSRNDPSRGRSLRRSQCEHRLAT